VDESGNRLIQLQETRFIHNWRKVKGTDTYPRFPTIKSSFIQRWEEFVRFVDAEEIGEITPNQLELTYLNHIEQGTVWASAADIADVFPSFRWDGSSTSDGFLPDPVGLSWTLRFPCEACGGHLSATLKEAKLKATGNGLLILEMTVRGFPESGKKLDLSSWFDAARESIVRGFTSLTSRTAHDYWERER
jgi:uncharacterized protein (TIGR04255 family)